MSEYNETVTKTTKTNVDDDGSVIQKDTKNVESTADAKSTAVNIVWYVFGLIAILLTIRFLLKIFGANSGNDFVGFVYSVTSVLSAPFDSIFGVARADAGNTQSVFEPSIIVAIAVYALIAWGIAKIITINDRTSS